MQLAISESGKLLFSATASGAIRTYKTPIENEFTFVGAHSSNITALAVSVDDMFLFSGGDDGLLFIFGINGSSFFNIVTISSTHHIVFAPDKDARLYKRKDDHIVFSDEILVSKSDIEEQTTLMSELKTRVEELKMANEYQLRLKDMFVLECRV